MTTTGEAAAAEVVPHRTVEGMALRVCAWAYAACFVPALVLAALSAWTMWRWVRVRLAIEAGDPPRPLPGSAVQPDTWMGVDFLSMLGLMAAIGLLIVAVVLTLVLAARGRRAALPDVNRRRNAMLLALALPLAVEASLMLAAATIGGLRPGPDTGLGIRYLVVDVVVTVALAASLVLVVRSAHRLASATDRLSPAR